MAEATVNENTTSPTAQVPAAKIPVERILVWFLFLASGACGLIYEVLWCRQLGLLFGNTAHSLSAVLTAFMSGLALGSFVAGRMCHRIQRPLFVYGILELLIGIYCALLPWFLGGESPFLPIYRSLYGETGSGSLGVARFAISFLLLLIPATFMGATLPVLSHFLVRSRSGLGRTVGALYAVNSFGAVLGAVAAGFFLLPELGKAGTNWVAVVCNLVLGGLAIFFGMNVRVGELDAQAPTETPPGPPLNEGGENGGAQAKDHAFSINENTMSAKDDALFVKLAVLTFGITGFAAMATQIGWTRAISLGTGSSTYAFSLIVAVFILGLSLGGSWGSRMAPRLKDPLVSLATILLLIGLMGLLVSLFLGFSPTIFFVLIAWGTKLGWSLLLLLQALGIALLIFVPTFLMGATMPLTVQIASRSAVNAGRTVGTVYAVNTVGSILGSFLGGLVLLPVLQIQYTLEVMALLYAVPGIALLVLLRRRLEVRQIIASVVIAVLFAGLALFAPRWDQRLMSSGIYLMLDQKMVKAAREFRFGDLKLNFDAIPLLYYNEGVESTVAVMQFGDELSLRVGGKPDASAHGDLITQVTLSIVPEVLHEKGPEDILVIGLGSGVSTGAALGPDTVKRVDVVEMSPQVVEASSFFKGVNGLTYTQPPPGSDPKNFHPWIATPKVEVLVNDGRNHLQLTSRTYDVIASEPSNPWMAGVGNLFTRESFELCHQHLKPGGIMCQWLHSYNLESAHFFSVLRTFASVFKHTQLWQAKGVDFMIIGSDSPLDVPLARLRERLKQPKVAEWLKSVHIDREAEFLAGFVADEVTFQTLIQNSELHTDDNMMLEFQAPRSLFGGAKTFRSTTRVSFPEKIMDLKGVETKDGAEFLAALDIAVAAREHWRHAIEGPGTHDAHLKAAYAIDPYQLWASDEQGKIDAEKALHALEVKPAPPADPDAALLAQAEQAVKDGKPDDALAALDKIPLPKASARQDILRAKALLAKRDLQKAYELAIKVMKSGEAQIEAVEIVAQVLNAAGKPQEAFELLQKALSEPGMRSTEAAAPLWGIQADLFFKQGNAEAALESVRLASELDRLNPKYGLGEATILNALKRPLDALRALRLRAARDPMRADLKVDFARALLAAAAEQSNPVLATDLRLHSKRACRESTVLQPNWAPGWEVLCRSLLAVESCDAPRATFWHAQAQDALAKLLALHQGDAAKVPKDLLNALQPAR
jgi:spermidine synthase